MISWQNRLSDAGFQRLWYDQQHAKKIHFSFSEVNNQSGKFQVFFDSENWKKVD